MLALLEHSPDIYLDELQEQLEEQHNIKVSISTLSNTLKRLGITSKKVSPVSMASPQALSEVQHLYEAISDCFGAVRGCLTGVWPGNRAISCRISCLRR